MCTSIVYRIRSINEYPAGNHHHQERKVSCCVLVLDNNYFSRNNINQEAEYYYNISMYFGILKEITYIYR